MTPTQIKQVLSEIGGGANKRLGQHFLVDVHALASVVEAAEIQKGERVLEIGPGLGVLTSALIESGAEVTAVERDRRFGEFLQSKFPEHFELIEGDASRLDWENQFKKKDWKLVSNLPYSISSLALRKALYAAHPPTSLVVLVQREVAERAIARDQKHSLLSLMVAFSSHESGIVKRVPAGAFFPPPKVESAILRIYPMTQEERLAVWGRDPEQIMALAKRGFAHPRKLLASNLQIPRTTLVEAGIPEQARAEDLRPEDWARLITYSV
ncbi:MAG: 16S rRNA (adenine(1518)-N(6)/adenine(1519)-N(6))-dimethyltransferase RsmA [Candidatus Uhrbacteria bacterium]